MSASPQLVLPPPPSAGSSRSRRPKKPSRLNINLGSSTSFGSAMSAPSSPAGGSSSKKVAARNKQQQQQQQQQVGAYRRSQTLDPELISRRAAKEGRGGGGGGEYSSSWVSFGSGGASTAANTAASTNSGTGRGGRGIDPPSSAAASSATAARTGVAAGASSMVRSSPTFIATTNQSFDITPPIHRSFLPSLKNKNANNNNNNNNSSGLFDNNNNTNSPELFSDNAFAEAAFTLEGREEVEVSRFEIDRSPGASARNSDDAPRDSPPASTITTTSAISTRRDDPSSARLPPPPPLPTIAAAPTASTVAGAVEGGRAPSSTRPDWSDMATWMRAPIDAITDAVITPVLPPRFDANNNNSNTTGSSATTTGQAQGLSTPERRNSNDATAAPGGATTSTSLPPRRPVGAAAGGTPTIRPPRPSGAASSSSRGAGTVSPATVSSTGNSSASSDDQNGGSGVVSSSSSASGDSGGGVAERRRTARSAQQNTVITTGIALRSPRLGRGRSGNHDDGSGGAGGGGGGSNGDRSTRGVTRRQSSAAPSTPTSTSARGRSSSRVRPGTPGSAGRGRSKSRTSGPSTPVSAGRRGRSVSRGKGTPGQGSTPTRGRSASRARTTPSRGIGRTGIRGRSTSGTPASRLMRSMPTSPSAQSTGGLSRSGSSGAASRNRGRTRSVSRTRVPPSPSANSTGGLPYRGGSSGTAWNRDSDNASVTSEPALRPSNTSRSNLNRRTLRSNSSSRLSAGSLRSLELAENDSGVSNRYRAGSTSSAGTSNNNGTSRNKKSKSFRREGGLLEKLFGDNVSTDAKRAYLPSRNQQQNMSSNVSVASGGSAVAQPEAVHTRSLLTASVYHNQATGLWIATINTNQKPGATNRRNAAKYLKAFSFHTEREARESAYANAPPKMVLFSESPNCFICRGKFAVFRRPSHCRNCGVCVCSSCTTTWASKMIPETYNMKKESSVKVCKSCNFLVLAFRRALLDGQYDEAIALYNTGNINLRCPFGNVKGGEAMYPIHCATEGGNLDLLRWLVDVHYCPISLVRTGNKKADAQNNNTPIVTSKGRSILNIAMSKQKVDMMRYLVTEKNVSVYEIKDLKTSLRALEAVLTSFPSDSLSDFELPTIGEDPINFDLADTLDMFDGAGDFDDNSILSDDDLRSPTATANGIDDEIKEMDSMSTAVADACIICYENSIDCVMTPCGHQICCLECSANLSTCPVCNSQGQFIRIFKP